jgi:hypothetical protein
MMHATADADCALCRPDPIFLHGKREKFPVTFFTDYRAQSLTSKDMVLPELRDLVLATSAGGKDKLPWLKLAVFGSARSAKGSLRHDENVEAISGVELDYDGGLVSFEDAVAAMTKARLLALVYTSPSHTAAAPRWRLLLPTSADLPPTARAWMAARVNGVLGGVIAPESFTLSQAYYYGKVGSNPDHRAEIVSGDFIDTRDDLEANACGVVEAGERKPNAKTVGYADEVAAAVAVIPNPDLDWHWWNRTAMAIFAATGGSDAGLEAFHAFSAKSTKYDKDATDAKWDRLHSSPPNRIGIATVMWLADAADPDWRNRYCDMVYERLQAAAHSPETIAWKAELAAASKQRTTSGGSDGVPPETEERGGDDDASASKTKDEQTPKLPRRSLVEVHATFRKWFGDEYDLDAANATAAAASEKLTGDPLWLLMISGPGAAKTETVQSLQWAGAHVTSTIASEGALLSASPPLRVASEAGWQQEACCARSATAAS